jgi:CheY-like chemotaxis protein
MTTHSKPASHEAHKARRKALLIEDNPDDAFLTERTLVNHGIADEVAVARDGVEALHHLFGDGRSEVGSLPSFVLLDLNLPRLSGLAVLRRIRAEKSTRQLPVIILTASPDERDKAESYGNGVSAYIQKPLDSHKLMFAIDDLRLDSRPSNRS